MKHDDLDAELKKLIYNLAENKNPKSLDMYFHAFKTIERNRLRWALERLDELQAKNHKLELELIKYRYMPWWQRIFTKKHKI